MNTYNPNRQWKELYNDNRDENLKIRKLYNDSNKEKYAQYRLDHKDISAQYRLDNKDKIAQYRLNNKDKITQSNKARVKTSIICQCGSSCRSTGVLEHNKTIKHMEYIKNLLKK